MYDTIIIGSGAAGYTAALYAVRYKLKTLVVGNQEGGQSALAHEIENYPGFENIKGPELMKRFKEHAKKFGAEMRMDEVTDVVKNDDGTFSLSLAYSGETLQTKTVLLATGTKRRTLGAKGEEKLYGKGVTYCATCDGFFFKEKVTAVIGGGDSAATAALYLADICPKVYLIVRKDSLRAEPIWVEKINKSSNIHVLYNTEVEEFVGNTSLEAVRMKNGSSLTDIKGCFIEIGAEPYTKLVEKFDIKKDHGFIAVNKDQSTSVSGLFAAGDITNASNNFHQVATAIGEGAIAAHSLFEYVSKK